MILPMRKHTVVSYRWLFVLSFLALAVVACGGTDQPAEQAEAADAAPQVASEAAPVPELRTNDAGAVLVTQEEVLRLIDAGTAPMILDVRTPEEFAEGHVPGAINISYDELGDRLGEIESARNDGLIVYCRSGRRAGIAEELLLGEGFSNVQHLEGDMIAWLEANRPVVQQQ
jgi:rhodanese-related sulfurtransferase